MKIRNRLGLTILIILLTVLLLAIASQTNYRISIADFLSAYTLSLAIYALEAWKEQKKQEDLLTEYRIISKSLITLTYSSSAFLKNAEDAFRNPERRTNQHEIGDLFIKDITSAHNEILTYLALHDELDPNYKMPIDEGKHISLINSIYELQATLSYFCKLEFTEGFQYSTANKLCNDLRQEIDECHKSAMKEIKKYHRS